MNKAFQNNDGNKKIEHMYSVFEALTAIIAVILVLHQPSPKNQFFQHYFLIEDGALI